MRLHLVVTLACIAPMALAPVAAHAADAASQQPQLARDDPNRVVCRRQEVTGTFTRTVKVCKTNAEWREQMRNAQEVGTDMQERGLINSRAPG